MSRLLQAQREPQRKDRAPLRSARNRHPASMRFHDSLRNRQPHARATWEAGAVPAAVVLVENPGLLVGRDAGSGIAHAYYDRIVHHARRNFNRTFRHGAEVDQAQLLQVAQSGAAFHKADEKYTIAPLHLGGKPVGSLAIRGETGATLTVVEAIANLIAIGLERARAIERAASAEAARRNEELRAALLDGLAHDLKTPLTAIKASVTSLISRYPRTEARREELLSIVDEETDRLHRIVSEAIQMARIDAGKVSLQRSPHALHEIVTGALGGLKLSPARVRLDIPSELPQLSVDADLVGQALKQLLDNADRYSPPGSPIEVSASVVDDSIVVSVGDSGPGVTPDEQSRIFDKYYRGRHSARFPDGTGMGLSIAKGIVEAHGGRLSVSVRPEGGSIFSLRLPLSLEQMRHE